MTIRLANLALAALLVLAPLSQACGAPTRCPADFLDGQAPDIVAPEIAARTFPLCYSEFGELYSAITDTPLWSADHLTAARVIRAERRRRDESAQSFHEELALPPAARSTLADYAHSGYDRGHMTPNGDMDNAEAQGQSFTLANMVPQWPANNRGIWEAIEAATRGAARRYGDVWVVTMPVFSGPTTRWLHNRVAIPRWIAKAIYIPALGRAGAYLTINGPGRAWTAIAISALTRMTGIDPFPALPAAVKRRRSALPAPIFHAVGIAPTGW